jgi:hypothetical protein
MSADNRKYPRKKIGHAAHVKLPIKVLDISRSGARLSADGPATLPDEFVLQINANLARWCRVKWREGEQIGVEFIDPREALPSAALGSPPSDQ